MSYQVLARKWRPRSFAALVGQEHVVRALSHALDQQRLHHAWLFTGTRGVGKTTLARILAKCLNCIGPDGNGGITSTPCGVCRPCVDIDAGRFVDYIEMDAASNRGVDEMAALLEQAVYAPANARFKVYTIDEVHMLTSHAFNAMLKTLEEPPPHVKFVLATTDPQKIPVTVLSRCLQFNLKAMPVADIAGHLERVLGAEGIALDRGALVLIGRAAAGSMRDALSLTDQAIAHGGGRVDEASVRDMLGALDRGHLLRILDALADDDGPALMTVVDEIAARSLSFGGALQELGTLLHRIALLQLAAGSRGGDRADDDADADADDARLAALASRLAPDDVQLYYQIAAHGRRDLSLAPDEETGFSMTLLRMLAFRVDEALPAAPAPVDAKRVATAAASSRVPAAAAASKASLAPPPVAPPPVAPPATVADVEPAVRAAARALDIGDWVALVERLGLTGLAAQFAHQSELVSHDERGVALRVAPSVKSLASTACIDKLRGALSRHFGRPVGVTVEVGAVSGGTVATARSTERAARQADAEALIDADPFVKAVVRDFGGAAIVPGSVKPV